MFGQHKQHPVVGLDEAVRDLRGRFDTNIKSGKLKVENTETVLVDIRQAMVQCDQQKNRILKEVDRVFGELIQTLKNRK